MVQLIVGQKGKGKTTVILDKVNEEIKTAKGNIVFLDKDSEHMFELNNKIRLINVSEYLISNSDEFIGFIFGIISSDYDIETIFIDGILKHDDVALGDMPEFLGRLKGIAAKYEIEIVVSLGAEKEELIGVDFDSFEIIN